MKWFEVRTAVTRLIVLVAVSAVLAGLVIAIPAIMTARDAGRATNQFTIESFDAAYTLARGDDGHAQLTVVETIVANFPRRRVNHGIFRSVPTSYRGRALTPTLVSVTDADGSDYGVDESAENGHVIWQIGNANTYVTGATTYTVRNAVQDFGDHQELYWDVNGDEWLQPSNGRQCG